MCAASAYRVAILTELNALTVSSRLKPHPSSLFPMSFCDQELEGYLDEALPAERMAAVEAALRGDDSGLAARLAAINARRDAGQHTLGEIWRAARVTCPARDELGSYLLGVLSPEAVDYLEFHVNVVGCRYCRANLEDLKGLQAQQAEAATHAETRRKKYFQSSAGYLRQR